MDIPGAALRLHENGFDVIPLEAGGKRPLPAAWQKMRGLDTLQVAALFTGHPGCNVGIITGGGLVVLDLDMKPGGPNGSESLAQLQAELGVLPATVTAITPSGGRHLYFYVPPGFDIKNSVSKLGPGIDVRGEGGQVVAPPSILADGRAYEWRGMSAPDTRGIAELPLSWLTRLLALQVEPVAPKGLNGVGGAERLVSKVGREAAKRRAAAYLAAMPPAVSGQGGHAQFFDAACRAVERCVDVGDAFDVLMTYNQRCEPPFDEWEVQHKLDDALKKHALGSAVDRQQPPAGEPRDTPKVSSTPPGGEQDPRDVISVDDNRAYWAAREAYARLHPGDVLPDDPDEACAILKRTSPAPGAGPLLAKNFEYADFKGQRPSTWVYNSAAQRPWSCISESLVHPGTTDSGVDHFLRSAGLNRRSRELFRDRVTNVAGDTYQYDSTERLVEYLGRKYLNLYQPTSLKPEAGDWGPIDKLMRHLIVKEEVREWVLDWLAWIVQEAAAGSPKKSGVSLVMYGAMQGTGKGVFGKVLSSIFGRHNVGHVGQDQLDETFTDWADGKLLVIANEVQSSDNRTEKVANKLKPLISDDEVVIRRMYHPATKRRSVANIVYYSNSERPQKIDVFDRRHTVIHVPLKRLDPEVAGPVADDAEADGPMVRAFYHHLLERKVTRFKRFIPLDTPEKDEVAHDTGTSGDKFIAELLEIGFHSMTTPYLRGPSSTDSLYIERDGGGRAVSRRVLYDVYRAWCEAEGYKPLGNASLYRLLRSRLPKPPTEVKLRVGDRIERIFVGIPGVDGVKP